jgi:hypothetical protein
MLNKEMAGEPAWGLALHRENVIRPLAERPRLSAESIAEAAKQLGLSRSILYPGPRFEYKVALISAI